MKHIALVLLFSFITVTFGFAQKSKKLFKSKLERANIESTLKSPIDKKFIDKTKLNLV